MLHYQQQFLARLDFKPPKEYLDYLFAVESTYQFGGAYLIEDDELLSFNADYEADEFYAGYFLIGSDGGGETFALEKATGNFIQLSLIGHDEDTATVVGRTWPEFLEYLQNGIRLVPSTCPGRPRRGFFVPLGSQKPRVPAPTWPDVQ
jgi:hypothetical protein